MLAQCSNLPSGAAYKLMLSEFSPKTKQYLDLIENPQNDPYFTGWADD